MESAASQHRIRHQGFDPGNAAQELRKFSAVDGIEIGLASRSKPNIGTRTELQLIRIVVFDPVLSTHSIIIQKHPIKQLRGEQVINDEGREWRRHLKVAAKRLARRAGNNRLIQAVRREASRKNEGWPNQGCRRWLWGD